MNGWIKYFAWGEPEYGSDQDVFNKKASWSKGRLSNIVGVEAYHNNKKVIKISGLGEYHQSDDYEIILLRSRPTRLVRRIQKKVGPKDAFVIGDHTNSKDMSVTLVPETIFMSESLDSCNIFCGLPDDALGKWLTIEYHIQYKEVSMLLSKGKI